MGLRGGKHPQMMASTTPRPIQMIRDLFADAVSEKGDTHLTTGTLHDNAANLPESFLRFIEKEYKGTRLERQEISGELLSDTEGSILSLEMLDALRVPEAPEMARIVVGVDPAGKSKNTSDLTGINVSGRGIDGHLYSLANRSCRLSPDGWARRVVEAYHKYEADLIVAEDNQGGEMIESVIRGVDGGRYVNIKSRTATRSKARRAEPVLAFYERGEAHIVGDQKSLEDQLVQFTPEGYDGESSPDDADAHIWAGTELMLGAQSTWDDMIQANAG
jgi:phage terminase large subunit-like protein